MRSLLFLRIKKVKNLKQIMNRHNKEKDIQRKFKARVLGPLDPSENGFSGKSGFRFWSAVFLSQKLRRVVGDEKARSSRSREGAIPAVYWVRSLDDNNLMGWVQPPLPNDDSEPRQNKGRKGKGRRKKKSKSTIRVKEARLVRRKAERDRLRHDEEERRKSAYNILAEIPRDLPTEECSLGCLVWHIKAGTTLGVQEQVKLVGHLHPGFSYPIPRRVRPDFYSKPKTKFPAPTEEQKAQIGKTKFWDGKEWVTF